MRKLIVLSAGEDYDVGGLVRFLIRMFDRKDIRNLFYENGLDIVTSRQIKDDFKMSDVEFLKGISENDPENWLIFGIHPYGLDTSLNASEKIKKIAWINDPHYFANYVERNGKTVQRFSEKYDPFLIKSIDYMITPSPVYFRNLKINEYDDKMIFFFYFLDEEVYEQTGNVPFDDRMDKIVLSGAIYEDYKSRVEFDNLRKGKKEFEEIVYKIEHPGYKNNSHMTELNYYNELTKYKAAFVGHLVFPINYVVAKHIEVLMCGCLGFFEPNTLLESELGLIAFEHYVPCCDENGEVIKDEGFYIKWMNSEEGKRISEKGKEYVRDRFGKIYIKEFIDILKKIG